MADRKNWLLIKHKDRFVAKTDLTEQNRSVLSNASVEEMKSVPAHRIAAERLVVAGLTEEMPATLAPMQAELGDKAFNHADWMWEPKLDGYRVLAFIEARVNKRASSCAHGAASIWPPTFRRCAPSCASKRCRR